MTFLTDLRTKHMTLTKAGYVNKRYKTIQEVTRPYKEIQECTRMHKNYNITCFIFEAKISQLQVTEDGEGEWKVQSN
jgi:hypothetical protein